MITDDHKSNKKDRPFARDQRRASRSEYVAAKLDRDARRRSIAAGAMDLQTPTYSMASGRLVSPALSSPSASSPLISTLALSAAAQPVPTPTTPSSAHMTTPFLSAMDVSMSGQTVTPLAPSDMPTLNPDLMANLAPAPSHNMLPTTEASAASAHTLEELAKRYEEQQRQQKQGNQGHQMPVDAAHVQAAQCLQLHAQLQAKRQQLNQQIQHGQAGLTATANTIPGTGTGHNNAGIGDVPSTFNMPLNMPMFDASLNNMFGLANTFQPPTQAVSNTIPSINRISPTEGPQHGGIEIVVLGSGFYNGLTLVFGGMPASQTHYWSPNVLVCLLPPSPVPGPVAVTFKEHPVLGMSGDGPVALFTYLGTSDRALMELALQVVGLRMTGRLEAPHQIAMRIVSDDEQSGDMSDGNGGGGAADGTSAPTDQSNLANTLYGIRLAPDALALQRRLAAEERPSLDFEGMLLQCLRVLDLIEGDNAADISVQVSYTFICLRGTREEYSNTYLCADLAE
jgi:hypothetical protein